MTHYEKLGLSRYASKEEIKQAYKKLIKKYHPDIYQGDKSYAEKMTKEINEAYSILSNPEKKDEYDEITFNNFSYTPPEREYDYTPPKYDSPPSNYNDYRKTYSRDYNYNYRYTDYHRNKTPNSNYYQSSPLEEKFINIFDTNKLVVIFLIFIIYVALLIFTFSQFYALKNNSYSGIINSPKKTEEQENTTSIHNTQDSQTLKKYEDFPSSYEDFNINDYISDKELYSIYSEHYSPYFSTFSEFKEAISKELFEYYYQLYY